MSLSSFVAELAQTAAGSDRVGYTVATGTIVMGLTLRDIQEIGAVLATYGGIVLTAILAIKHVVDTVIRVRNHLRRRSDDIE